MVEVWADVVATVKSKWNSKRSSQQKWQRLSPQKKEYLMHTIYGENVAAERIRNDNMKPNQRVAIDHDFYSANPEASKKKMKEVDDANKPSGMEVGYSGRMKETGKDYDDKRSRYAIGGVAKLRMDYEGA